MTNISKINVDGTNYTIGQESTTGVKMVLLWTNSNVKAGVETLTVNINLAPYAYVCVEYYWDNSANPPILLGNPSPVGKPGLLSALSADAYTVSRGYITSTSQVVFNTGYMNGSPSGTAAIPYKIYGMNI